MRNYYFKPDDAIPLEIGCKYLVCFYPRPEIHEVQVLRISEKGFIKLDYDVSEWYYREEITVLEKLK